MSDNRFFVDGKYIDEDSCRNIFSKNKLESRQLKCFELIEGKKIVDIGCYNGSFVKYIADNLPDIDIVGIDYYEENIKIAKFLYPELEDRFRVMSVYELKFEDASLDCITFQEVIEHIDHVTTAILEMKRILKKHGTMVISTTNPYYWRDILSLVFYETKKRLFMLLKKQSRLKSLIFFDNVEWNRHIYCWTPSTLFTLLEVNGFEYVEHCYGQDSKNVLEKAFLFIFPYFSSTQIIKVRKT